jgi:hypothetical protein
MYSLEITGKLGHDALADFPILSSAINDKDVYIVFSMRQDNDIPIGTIFSYELEDNGTTIKNLFELIAATQQYNFLMSEIPRGWNAICVFKAVSSPPFILDSLPIVEDWYENSKSIILNYVLGDLGA